MLRRLAKASAAKAGAEESATVGQLLQRLRRAEARAVLCRMGYQLEPAALAVDSTLGCCRRPPEASLPSPFFVLLAHFAVQPSAGAMPGHAGAGQPGGGGVPCQSNAGQHVSPQAHLAGAAMVHGAHPNPQSNPAMVAQHQQMAVCHFF